MSDTYPTSVDLAADALPAVPDKVRADVFGAFEQAAGRLRSTSLRQGAVVLVDQGCASLATFLTGVLIARACAADRTGFGHYVFGMTLMVTILGFQRGLISLPYTVLSPHIEQSRKPTYLGNLILHHLAMCSLLFASAVIARTVLAAWGSAGPVSLLCLPLTTAILGRLTLDLVRTVLLAELHVWRSLAIGLLANLATLAVLACDYAGGRLSVSRAFLVCAACWTGPSVIALVVAHRRIRFCLPRISRDFVANFRVGKWMAATDAVFMVARQMIPWILAATWGSAELALLGACDGVSGMIGYASRGLSAFFLPKMSHAAGNPRRLRRMVVGSLSVLVPAAVCCVVGALLAGEWLLATLYSSSYRGLTGPLVICCLSSSLGLISVPVNQAVHAVQRSDVGFKALLYSLPLSLCLGSLLTWRFGAWGAALSTLLGVAGAFGHRAFFLSRYLAGEGALPAANSETKSSVFSPPPLAEHAGALP